jgi:mannose-1-phosphate guanylyltransferase
MLRRGGKDLGQPPEEPAATLPAAIDRATFHAMRYAMIMAGGSGTRLWPMSRRDRPKQLLPLIRSAGSGEGGRPVSLLQLAAARLEGLVPPERRYICAGESFRQAIKAVLPEFSDDRILGEPQGRDTVNAVGFAAAVLDRIEPAGPRGTGAIFAVLTADHVIEPADVFRERMDLGFRLVEADPRRLVTFSIKPTHAATGYGYVERGAPITDVPGSGGGGSARAFRVVRFVEKPNAQRAQAYVESGHFGWNSGMFVFSAATFLDCLRRFKPESYEGVMKIGAAWGTARQKAVIEEVYPSLPKISVDYAIMEPAARDDRVSVCTVLMDVNWLDVGSWPSYGETLAADREGNRVGGAGAGRALIVQGRGNLVVSDDPSHTVAVLGAEDLVVVHTRDATLVMPRARAEDLKTLHGMVEEGLR